MPAKVRDESMEPIALSEALKLVRAFKTIIVVNKVPPRFWLSRLLFALAICISLDSLLSWRLESEHGFLIFESNGVGKVF